MLDASENNMRLCRRRKITGLISRSFLPAQQMLRCFVLTSLPEKGACRTAWYAFWKPAAVALLVLHQVLYGPGQPLWQSIRLQQAASQDAHGLQRSKPGQVSRNCQEQLFRQEVENADDVRLSPHLARSCQGNVLKFCKHTEPGVQQYALRGSLVRRVQHRLDVEALV